MNDLVLYGAGLVFFFLLWIYSGGPNKPISFSGPYITPVTGVDQTQVGYGPQILGSSTVRTYKIGGKTVSIKLSPYSSAVKVISVHSASVPTLEYVTLQSEADHSIQITGWQLISATRGTQTRIPNGTHAIDGKNTAVLLASGESADITSGTYTDSDYTSDYNTRWHAYLGQSHDLWSATHDTITLLDSDGKVVDQYSY